ncbi:anti-anti-sigma factor [Nannocystis exedens]|uniref:Anti-anti-sigma factor n=1 Tax=Nannocystis exedens TaxID=54 RepID=A0A1I2ERV7_9BACT|nr:STAS domain-containing protein [Nannocystis exedens]PCC73859.1 RsbT co-antagonist protein RsbRA [Nannocystis exedens]SFE95206.1 anti-anti-sigma factor [Nannocystis exedens]
MATADPALKFQVLTGLLESESTTLISIDVGEVLTLTEGRGLEAMGVAATATVGAPLTAAFAGHAELIELFRRSLRGERSRVERMYGQACWLLSFYPLRGPDGAIVGAAMLAIDVTRDLTTVRQAQMLRELVNNVPTNVFAVDIRGVCEISEGGLLKQIGLKPGQNVGVNVFEAYSATIPDLADAMSAAFRGETRVIEFAFGDSLYSQTTLPRRDAHGNNAGAYCIASDITEQRRIEELLRSQMRIIQEQKEAILRLSSPIIEVGHDALAVPLVGSIDEHRAAIIMHGLLEAIVQKRARFAILDLTGVDTVDPTSAEHLIRIIHSVRLLGAQAVITGIRPPIARTMAELGLDLSRLHTLRSLQEALRYCSESIAGAR